MDGVVSGGTKCNVMQWGYEAVGNDPAWFVREIGATYIGNIVDVSASRASGTNFNLVTAIANDVPVCAGAYVLSVSALFHCALLPCIHVGDPSAWRRQAVRVGAACHRKLRRAERGHHNPGFDNGRHYD